MRGNFKPPWDLISKQVSQDMSVNEILRIASADYEVILSPVQVENLTTGKFVTVPDRFVTGRFDYSTGYLDNWEVVKGRYEVIPNSIIVQKSLSLLNDNRLKLDRSGILDNGRKFFVIVEASEMMILNEIFKTYIAVMTSHDGTSPISYYFLTVRPITKTVYRLNCEVESFIKKKHTPNTDSWLEESQSISNYYSSWYSSFRHEMNTLSSQAIIDDQINYVLDHLWPTHNADTERKEKHREDVVSTVLKLYNSEYNRSRTGKTALSLLSSIYDYYDKYRNISQTESAQQSLELDNHANRQKLKAHRLIKEISA